MTHVHRYIRLFEIAISVYVLMAIIKKRLKIDTRGYWQGQMACDHLRKRLIGVLLVRDCGDRSDL